MAKGITLKDKNGGTLYPKTVADLVLDSETGEPIGKVITSMGKITTDDKNGWLRVEGEGKSYFVELTELVTPNAPTIGITIYDVVKDSFDILVKNNTTGATMEYKIGENDTWKQIPNNNKITYDTGYTNEKKNDPIYLKIHLRATKNGVESGENIVDITVTPKVASGSVTVVRTSEWSTEATIKLSASQTRDAKSEYSTDGVSWTEFSGTETIEVSTSEDTPKTITQGTYTVRASKEGGVYKKADDAQNGSFTIGARKAYYGGTTKEQLSSLSDIQSLGNSKEASTYSGSITFTTTEVSYIWLCCTGILGEVYSDPKKQNAVPFEKPIVISGYNCYRRTEKDIAAEHTFHF